MFMLLSILLTLKQVVEGASFDNLTKVVFDALL